MRERECRTEAGRLLSSVVDLLLKRNEGLGLDYRCIYIGYFCNFKGTGFLSRPGFGSSLEFF